MKNPLIILLLILNYQLVNAQYRKIPLDINHYWQQYAAFKPQSDKIANCGYQLSVISTTIINGKEFKLVNSSNVSCDIYGTQFGEGAYIREDTILRRVTTLINNQEFILYNFNKNVGDTALLLNIFSAMATQTLMVKDSILLGDGLYHTTFVFNAIPLIIEGVGSVNGLLTPWNFSGIEARRKLLCFGGTISNVSIYSSSDNVGGCPITTNIPVNTERRKTVSIYPNPASNACVLSLDENFSSEYNQIELRNVLGELMFKYDGINLEEYKLNTSYYPSGIYYVTVFANKKLVAQQKLIIIK
jgi:hypothetical protein